MVTTATCGLTPMMGVFAIAWFALWSMRKEGAGEIAGVLAALLGLVIPALRLLYDYAWFVGLLVAGALHFVLADTSFLGRPVR